MSRYSCYIIDDMSKHSDFLGSLLQEYHPEIEVIGVSKSIKDAVQSIQKKRADIVFLDIELKDGLGFEIAKEIPATTSIVITSAHTKYAYNAFIHNAVDYLAKPISLNALDNAIRKAIRYRLQDVPEAEVSPGDTSSFQKSMILVNAHNSVIDVVEIANIVFLKAEGKYTTVYLSNDKPALSSKNLGEFEHILPEQFVRVHHSYLVNLSYVRSFMKEELLLLMKSGENIPVSFRKKENFLRMFQRL